MWLDVERSDVEAMWLPFATEKTSQDFVSVNGFKPNFGFCLFVRPIYFETWIRTKIGCSAWCPLGVRLTIGKGPCRELSAESATSLKGLKRGPMDPRMDKLTFVQYTFVR